MQIGKVADVKTLNLVCLPLHQVYAYKNSATRYESRVANHAPFHVRSTAFVTVRSCSQTSSSSVE